MINLVSGILNIVDTCLLALYVNAPDAESHFKLLVFHTDAEKTKPKLQVQLERHIAYYAF